MCLRFSLSVILGCALSSVAGAADDAAQLMALIQSEQTSDVDRANAFEKIGDVAGDEAIEPLVGFLADDKWSHYARNALQKMDGESVTNALIDSLDKLQGDLRLGVLDSIGRRGDPVAVPPLTQRLGDADDKVAAAAAVALGSIGTPQAATALVEKLGEEGDERRKESLASSLLLAAQRLTRNGNQQEAIDVFDRLRQADLPKAHQIGATQNAILARGAVGAELMEEQLTSPDDDFFRVGLAVARTLPGDAATETLMECLRNESSTDRQALLILALKDRGDRRAKDAVVERLKSESEAVQLAAIEALAALGDSASVPLLLSIGSEDHQDEVLASLMAIKADGVNESLLEAVSNSEPSVLAIQALGRRRSGKAVPVLLKLSEADSDAISQEAIVALGLAATQDRFLDLFEILKTAKSDQRKSAIQDAIRAAVFRCTQPDACAEALGQMIPESSGADREFLFEQMRVAGGEKAVELMREYAVGTDDSLQDAATQTLGRWLSADAAPVLLQVAQSDGKYANRALGGYIRIFRQFELPEDDRVAMAAEALRVANRPAERNAAIDAMTRFPCVGTFELALAQLDAPGSEQQAAQAVLTIGRTVLDLDPDKGQAGLQKLIDANISDKVNASAKALLGSRG